MKTNLILGRRSFQRSIQGGLGLGRYIHLHRMGFPGSLAYRGTGKGDLLPPAYGFDCTVETRRMDLERSTWTVVTY